MVNALTVDQYVKGVIPNESPASWPMAALKAQAVASRSYAPQRPGRRQRLRPLRRHPQPGLQGPRKRDRAQQRSRRRRPGARWSTYQGKIAETYFSACSGGHTESVQNVFFGPAIPYLVGVPDPYDYYCPLHSWTLRFSGPEISAKLGAYLDGRLKQIVDHQARLSPRIVWARLYGTGGVTTIRGDQLESALGAYDQLDDVPEDR